MFDFYVYTPHGAGWRHGQNVQANDYRAAARAARRASGAARVRVDAADRAAACAMGDRWRVVVTFGPR